MIEDKKEQSQDIKYPRFISSMPCGEDHFASKSQERIADNICRILQNVNSCKIIGIDGGWGSGKSNLVTIVRNKLKGDNFHFFIYDAWGHQEDLQRRSILEELTEDLTEKNKILTSENWANNLKDLLSKTKETENKTIPSLSLGIVVSVLVLVLTPVFKILSDNIDGFVWRVLIMGAPFLIFILLYFYKFFSVSKSSKNKNDGKKSLWKKIKNKSTEAFKELFYLYQKEQIKTKKLEKISEDEPSVRKFRNYIKDISDDLVKLNYQLVIVFDNMDRLPKSKVQELWSSIHTFFAENSYDNIAVIVPFDREHIQTAFMEGDKDKRYGNDFINKTFSVVYRVSPPILSDWKEYFKERWNYAFENNLKQSAYEHVVQVYDILAKDITPRRIIAFINEFASIKQIQSDIGDEYIALFILKKSEILLKPFEQIIKPEYLEGALFIFENDENLPKNIGSLVYQIPADKAIQIIYTERLKNALDNNKLQDAQIISESNEFDDILQKAVASVSNVENATLCLNTLDKKINPLIWQDLYRKIKHGPSESSKIREYQKILLQQISEKKIYLKTIISQFANAVKFSAVDYYTSINDLEKLSHEKSLGLEIKETLFSKETTVEDFIPFLKLAKDNQKDYQIKCDNNKLDDYLSNLPVTIEELEKNDFIPYIINDYSLGKYVQKLEENINANKNVPSNTILMGWLYKRYKEALNKKPINLILEPQFIHSFFNQTNSGEEFYFDLIAMRISLFNNMVPIQFATSINNILEANDSTIIDKLFNQIEYFVTYNNLLLNLKDYSKFPVYLEVVKKLTSDPHAGSELSLLSILQNFKTICENGLDPESLIKRLNDYQEQKTQINIENLKSIIPELLFFQTALKVGNQLTEYLIKLLKEYLDRLSIDEWKVAMKDENTFEFQASILLKDYQYKSDAVQAIKLTLLEVSGGEIEIPKKNQWQEVIEKLKKESGLFMALRDVRDKFYTSEISPKLFIFFGNWLFNYADLNNGKEVIRKIFTSEVLHNGDCLRIVSEHADKLKLIIQNSDSVEKTEFEKIIKDLLSEENNEPAKIIADKIGVKKEKNKDKKQDN